MKKCRFIVSLFLVISIMVSLIPGLITVAAVSDDYQDKASVTEFDLPDIVESNEAIEHGYIGRVISEEKDLHTFVFRNEDGTNTMRIYDHPVKYIDDFGEVHDISLDIIENDDGNYISAEHEVKTTFRRKLTDGITLEYNNIEIKMIPLIKSTFGTSRQIASYAEDMKSVSYAIDGRTSYEYSLTYAGFKEDIVVSEYTGQTEYDFVLYTNGLALTENDGSYYLTDEEGTVQATIGDIIIFTADNRNNALGSMTYETIKSNREYLITIQIDADYLRDDATAYPIRIDPTIEVNYDKNGSRAIEDVTINSLAGSSGSSGSLYVGLRSTYGISRTLMRFPELDLSVIPSSEAILAAAVELRDIMCEADALQVNCYVFTGNEWTESTANWSNVKPDSYMVQMSYKTVSYANGAGLTNPHRYSFDISPAVRGWKNNTLSQSKGIIFKAYASVEQGSSNIYKTFASYNRASNQPSLTITYLSSSSDNTYYIAFQSDGKMMSGSSAGTLQYLDYSSTNTNQKWLFTEVSSGKYIICMSSDTRRCLTAVPGTSKIILSDAVAGDTNQYWSVVNVSGEQRVLQSASDNSSIKGKHLYYTDGNFMLSGTGYSLIGLLNSSTWVSCTKIEIQDQIVSLGGKTAVSDIKYYPEASYINGNWISYSISSSATCTLSNGQLSGVAIGTATLTVTDKITKKTASCKVYVSYPTKFVAYYDNAFVAICKDNFKSTPSEQISEFFKDVRLEYARRFNINLIVSSKQLFTSYPELTNCPNANSPNLLCSCAGVCANSTSATNLKTLHHKNSRNIFYRIPKATTSKNLNILFSGHLTCKVEDGNSECSKGPLGTAHIGSGITLISVNPNNSNGISEGKIKKTLAHEMGHLFKVGDHYNGSDINMGQNSDCIWGENRNVAGVYSTLKMCSYCRETIQKNAALYNHS